MGTLYGADMAVHPDYQRRGVSGMLYKRRKSLLKRFNLNRMIAAYGRITGYKQYAGMMSAEQFVQKVENGELKDAALNAHLKAGYKVKKVQLDITVDRSSLNYSTFLEMVNPDYNIAKKKISSSVFLKMQARMVRICSAQYHMKPINSFGEADPNAEAVVVSELALSALALQRHVATVRPLHDRPPDLYELSSKNKIEIVKAE